MRTTLPIHGLGDDPPFVAHREMDGVQIDLGGGHVDVPVRDTHRFFGVATAELLICLC